MSLATFTLTTLTTLVPSITPSTTTVLRYDDGELERAIEGQKRECLIKMTWNWHTVDACFLAERWQVRSAGHMAMICISVLLLAVLLEAFRRLVKEYDHYLIRRHKKRLPGSSDPLYPAARGMDFELTGLANPPPTNPPATNPPPTNTLPTSLSPKPITNKPKKYKVYRPSFGAQLLRALLRAMHFAIAYIVMLLGMYYNGYILLCIFLGVFFGFLLFHWTRLEEGSKHDIDHADEATGCCCG
ncbi:Ctr copper transporter family-domain-containing protein [Podospora australis]|uniref:Copper transport protein n=1 Tax=Podospora australis TaxID=1536484 RepID=A0AAN6X1M2_9PEZI|nr:Ctr copper transporter family-domain-containing protein [Podospora australis]